MRESRNGSKEEKRGRENGKISHFERKKERRKEEKEERRKEKKGRGEEEYIVAIGRGEYEKTKSHH